MRSYVLTAAAEADLRGVIDRTRKSWGEAQVRRYVTELERCSVALAAGRLPFKDLSVVYPALRAAHCGHHYVFCLPRADAPVLIVAILHERMDLPSRLSDRLRG